VARNDVRSQDEVQCAQSCVPQLRSEMAQFGRANMTNALAMLEHLSVGMPQY